MSCEGDETTHEQDESSDIDDTDADTFLDMTRDCLEQKVFLEKVIPMVTCLGPDTPI